MPLLWLRDWPNTDFSKSTVPFSSILSGGPGKDQIPALSDPEVTPLARLDEASYVALDPQEPVISIRIGDTARAYPLSLLIWHEIVNDRIESTPIAVTFCPLCNSAIVFDRRLASTNTELYFGTTGNLRRSDLVMYDRQTESWWQQFEGRAILGTLAGEVLKVLPSRLESFAQFMERHPEGELVVDTQGFQRPYGTNPYRYYDTPGNLPFLYQGELPPDIEPLARVVSLEGRARAWSLAYLRMKQEIITEDGVRLRWRPGQASALDAPRIADGKDVGTVTAQRFIDGSWRPIIYFVDFAFAFHAFHPTSPILVAEE